MLNYDQEFTQEKLEENTETLHEPKQSNQSEEEGEPVNSDFSSKSVDEVFSLTNQVIERVLETDHSLKEH